jgi:uncharacterized repeat protein (TIGR03803 family)
MRIANLISTFALFVALITIGVPTAAQTFSVLHTFTGGGDGGKPNNGLTLDRSGNLYGTTPQGGLAGGCGGPGCGIVFKLTQRNSAWVLNPLYTFTGGSDGASPWARVTIGSDGTLFGTTILGGQGFFDTGTGVVFNLRPPSRISSRVLTPWNETVIYTFGNMSDGNYPEGDLIFDAAGNLYGTTQQGGFECEDTVWCGVVYQLARNGGGWRKTFIWQFNSEFVAFPYAGVTFDQAGNIYGTATINAGAVYQLVRHGIWTLTEIHAFGGQGDGYSPFGGLVTDAAGNLYGGTASGGANGAGAVYKLSQNGGTWTESVIYSPPGNGVGPTNTLAWDAAGNLYGTTCTDGAHNSGSVFKLTPTGDGWIPTTLYDFTGGSDGLCPYGALVVDANGNIFGTTMGGGSSQQGVIFEITQ